MVGTDPMIGRQLGGVRIDRMIGRGGMARVYYGWDDRLQRPVAIKVIGENYAADPSFVERFLREARTVASLRHPNILQVYYAGEEDGSSYFVMEYIQGMNLEQALRRQTQAGRLLPYQEVIRVGRAAGSALDYAHAQGVIHRDVKPSNIILADDGRVVLADFGLALHSTTSTLGQVFGSPHYIAPEQARNSSLAVAESDLYSLGVVLYEMLTGRTPFHDPSPAALALQHMTQPPPRPSSINPVLNQRVDEVLLRALSKNPPERFGSAVEMVSALEGALRGAAVDNTQPATMRVLPYVPPPQASPPRQANPEPVSNTMPGQYVPAYPANPQATAAYPAGGAQRVPPPPPLIPRASGIGRFLACGTVILILLVFISALAYAAQNSGFMANLRIPTWTPSVPLGGENFTPTMPVPDYAATQTAEAPPPPTDTPAPLPTGTPVPTDTPAPTDTPVPTDTPAPPTPTPAPVYDLIVLKSGAESMFVVNAGNEPFPLPDLQITNGVVALPGRAWGTNPLDPGKCVAVWLRGDRPAFPKGLQCDWVGANLRTNEKRGFWADDLQLEYQGQLIGICPGDQAACEFKFTAPAPQ